MRTRIGWTIGAACVILAGFAVLPARAQDVRSDRQDLRQYRQDTWGIGGDRQDIRQDTRAFRGDKPEKDRKNLQASRQQLRDAYKSGDPAAIKAARENYQKTRGELRGDVKDRRHDLRELSQDRRELQDASAGPTR